MKNLAKVFSAELDGIDAKLIEVEVDLSTGLHSVNIVGLADKALSEAKERINSAIKNSGIKPPQQENKRITINLAPADIKKTGSQYDLAMTIGYLLATGQVKEFQTENKIFLGELALDGSLRPIAGALNTAQLAKELGFEFLLLPEENAKEASLISDIKIIPLKNLKETIDYLEGRLEKNYSEIPSFSNTVSKTDFSEIKGLETAKRALIIAAAGGHNLLMVGPPGSGKSMLAKGMVSILPLADKDEAIEILKIYSSAGLLNSKNTPNNSRPFRAPHHSASAVSIVGGGSNPKPGEISLAHRGVLFLDELPEFRRDILESLRQPLENGEVVVARAKGTLTFPAKFSLVAAMNPCPCGYYGDQEKECRCSAYEVFRYQKKVSGPLLDRIDIQINVPRTKTQELREKNQHNKEDTENICELINKTRKKQKERFKLAGLNIFTNSEMSSKDCDNFIKLTEEAEDFLKTALEDSFISARGYYRILKTALTIADLEDKEMVEVSHIAEAFSYRLKEK